MSIKEIKEKTEATRVHDLKSVNSAGGMFASWNVLYSCFNGFAS